MGTQPSDTTVKVGGAITLKAIATGSTPMTWKWQKGGVDVSGATGTGLTATFTKSKAKAGDAGSYTCIFTNKAGSVTSGAAQVTVN